MKAQNVCAIICTVISVLSWLFGDNVAGRIGEKNMQRLLFAITMGFVSYAVFWMSISAWQFFIELGERKKKKDEIKYDVGKFKPVHLGILRALLEEGTLVLNSEIEPYIDYLIYNKYVGRITPSKIALTKKGKETAMKLEKEGKL